MRTSHRGLVRAVVALIAAGGAVLGSAPAAFATTSCSGLQAALDAAADGSTVALDPGSTCTNGPFTLPAGISITLDGNGSTLDGGGASRLLVGNDVGTTLIRSLTFRRGFASAAGGGVAIGGNSSPTFEDTQFVGNTSGAEGGAVYIAAPTGGAAIEFKNSTFGDGTGSNANTALEGGAIALDSARDVALVNVSVSGNIATGGAGGGLQAVLENGADISIKTSSFESNTSRGSAQVGGGGASVRAATASSQVEIDSSHFDENSVDGDAAATDAEGGGLQLSATAGNAGNALIKRSTFNKNVVAPAGNLFSTFSTRGAGLASSGFRVAIDSSSFNKNQLPQEWGSGSSRGSALSILGCPSGGVDLTTISDAVVSGNYGAGVLLGSVFVGCTSVGQQRVEIRNATITANSSLEGVAGVRGGGSDKVAVYNSIVWGNGGAFLPTGFSSIDAQYSDLCIDGSSAYSGPGNICVSPQFAGAADGDVYQLRGSATIDAGSTALMDPSNSDDYVGNPRLADGDNDGSAQIDIGAHERTEFVSCDRLQADLDSAPSGARLRLAEGSVCSGSFMLPPRAIKLEGAGSGATFDGSGSGPSLNGNNVGRTVLDNLTFINGTGADGGAVALTGDSAPTFHADEFYGNSTPGVGGAIHLDSTSADPVAISNSVFGDGSASGANLAAKGGAVYIDAPKADLSIVSTAFKGNAATGGVAGALYVAGGTGKRELSGDVFLQNSASPDAEGVARGGAVYLEVAGTQDVSISTSRFAENTLAAGTEQIGAGLEVRGLDAAALARQFNNEFADNTVATGALMPARAFGGGEAASSVRLYSAADRFVGNVIPPSVSAGGAGLAFVDCGASTSTSATLINATFVRNQTAGAALGGAIYAGCGAGDVALAATNITLFDNDGSPTAGIWGDAGDMLELRNSIVASAQSASEDIGGFGSRTIEYSDVCDAELPPPGAGNICTDPQLQEAASGVVYQTATSPTIDKGDDGAVPPDVVNDADGDGRIMDGNSDGTFRVDIGSDEWRPRGSPPPPVVQSPVSDAGGPVALPPGFIPEDVAASPPEQGVAGVKVPNPTKKPVTKKQCGDRTGPASRFLNRLQKAARFRGPNILTIYGKAAYKKCKNGDKGRIKLVRFTLRFVQGAKCRWLTARRTLGPPTSCKRKRVYFKAKGTTSWSFRLRGPFPPGKYLADVQAVDNLGNRERPGLHRNFRHFRINGMQRRQGWTGTHPDDYTKRG